MLGHPNSIYTTRTAWSTHLHQSRKHRRAPHAPPLRRAPHTELTSQEWGRGVWERVSEMTISERNQDVRGSKWLSESSSKQILNFEDGRREGLVQWVEWVWWVQWDLVQWVRWVMNPVSSVNFVNPVTPESSELTSLVSLVSLVSLMSPCSESGHWELLTV